ncbi:MAG TPA: DUF5320 domain-containing protein [Methanolinea sp.]|nr:DUF5320 domain-containing protein [Methanolinea sp.]
MPGFDGTGPLGRGPMTGWGTGRCRAYGTPIAGQSQAQDAEGPQETPQGTPPVQPGNAPPGYYGLGRGGIPRGCGRRFGGGHRSRCFC